MKRSSNKEKSKEQRLILALGLVILLLVGALVSLFFFNAYLGIGLFFFDMALFLLVAKQVLYY